MATQGKWHFCHKCFGMFYGGDQQGRRGRCPSGGGHEAYGFNFALPHTAPETAVAQQQWRFCHKCFGMFYNGDPRGRCPSGGSHEAHGFNFVLPHDVAESPGTQQQWRFCRKCFGMFYNGDPRGRRGRCPSGGGHEASGFNFVLPHTAEFVQLPAPPPPPPTPPPVARPAIAASYERASQTFTVTGSSFVGNRAVYIRFVNHAALQNPVSFQTASDGAGRINFSISFPINVPQVFGISANDGRPNPGDLTGTLWSNTVTITAA